MDRTLIVLLAFAVVFLIVQLGNREYLLSKHKRRQIIKDKQRMSERDFNRKHRR